MSSLSPAEQRRDACLELVRQARASGNRDAERQLRGDLHYISRDVAEERLKTTPAWQDAERYHQTGADLVCWLCTSTIIGVVLTIVGFFYILWHREKYAEYYTFENAIISWFCITLVIALLGVVVIPANWCCLTTARQKAERVVELRRSTIVDAVLAENEVKLTQLQQQEQQQPVAFAVAESTGADKTESFFA